MEPHRTGRFSPKNGGEGSSSPSYLADFRDAYSEQTKLCAISLIYHLKWSAIFWNIYDNIMATKPLLSSNHRFGFPRTVRSCEERHQMVTRMEGVAIEDRKMKVCMA